MRKSCRLYVLIQHDFSAPTVVTNPFVLATCYTFERESGLKLLAHRAPYNSSLVRNRHRYPSRSHRRS